MSSELQTLIGQVISNPGLAEALSKNPEQTLRDNGIEPTPEMVEALDTCPDLRSLTAILDSGR